MPTKEKSLATNLASDKFVLRLPDGMRDKIQALAKASGRTMNAEIVAALQEWISREDEQPARDKALAALMELQAQQIAEIGQLRTIIEAKMAPPPPPRAPANRARAEGLDAVAAALNRGDAKGALLAIAEMPDLSVPTRFLDKYLQKRKAKNPQT
ncbi:MAG: Arc family DNA-binding protein [Pseudomonadota bacterium]